MLANVPLTFKISFRILLNEKWPSWVLKFDGTGFRRCFRKSVLSHRLLPCSACCFSTHSPGSGAAPGSCTGCVREVYWACNEWLSSKLFLLKKVTFANYSVLEKWTFQTCEGFTFTAQGSCSSDSAATLLSRILKFMLGRQTERVFACMEGKGLYVQLLECLDERVPWGLRLE